LCTNLYRPVGPATKIGPKFLFNATTSFPFGHTLLLGLIRSFAPVALAHVPGEESKAKRNYVTNTTTNKALTLVAAVLFSISAGPGSDQPTQKVSGGHALIPVIRLGDRLFGSTVDAVDLGRFGLDDRFEFGPPILVD
jgi:hypothetical protein